MITAMMIANWKNHLIVIVIRVVKNQFFLGAMLPYELLGDKGRQLTNCGRTSEEKGVV